MIIKKHVYIAVLSLALLFQGISANSIKHISRFVTSMRNSFNVATAPVKKNIHKFSQPFKNDASLLRSITPNIDKKVVIPTQNALRKYIPNDNIRSKLEFKCFEYAITFPGLALAATGCADLAAFLAFELPNQHFAAEHNHWGLASGIALIGGASYYHMNQAIRKQAIEQMEKKIQYPKKGFDEALGGGINSHLI